MIDALVPAMTIFTYKGTDGARVVVKDVPRDPVAFTRMNDSIMDLIQNDDTPELEISRQMVVACFPTQNQKNKKKLKN